MARQLARWQAELPFSWRNALFFLDFGMRHLEKVVKPIGHFGHNGLKGANNALVSIWMAARHFARIFAKAMM